MKPSRDDYIALLGAVALGMILLGCLIAWGELTTWEYNECLKVGHSEDYCTAQAAGCL